MEGWTVQDFFNSINFWVVAWVVGLVLAIPLSLIANFLTDPLRNWWARRSAKRAERRNRELDQQLRSIEALTQSSLELGLRLATFAIVVLICFAMGSAVIALASINLWWMSAATSKNLVLVGGLLYVISIIVGVGTISTIERVRGFEAYRERMKREIANQRARASRQP
jgi:hypothetical protein